MVPNKTPKRREAAPYLRDPWPKAASLRVRPLLGSSLSATQTLQVTNKHLDTFKERQQGFACLKEIALMWSPGGGGWGWGLPGTPGARALPGLLPSHPPSAPPQVCKGHWG